MGTQELSRRERGSARLAELADEPGGEAFLANLGDVGDLVVDFAFGDAHCHDGLPVRERELVINALKLLREEQRAAEAAQ
jgi:hypothetical protein